MSPAPPLVLLHGFTGGPASLAPLAAALPERFCVTPSLPGHGRAPARVDGWAQEVAKMVAALEERLDAPAHLVGYSMGGRIACGLVCAAPRLFCRATFVGTHPGLEAGERPARQAREAGWMRQLVEGDIEGFLRMWEALPMWESQRSLPEAALAAQRRIRRGHTARGLADAVQHLGLGAMPDLHAELAELSLPMDFVVGELDARHRGISTRAAARCRDARVVTVPGAGHNVPLERPAALAELIERRRGDT